MKFVGFLRGINVGGHHKLPMAELKKVLSNMGYTHTITLLNSGNIIFESEEISAKKIEAAISLRLKKEFHFEVPVIIRKAIEIEKLYRQEPFKQVEIGEKTRLYITFLKYAPKTNIAAPWRSEDKSFQIIAAENQMILSHVDLQISGTIEAMKNLEKLAGKDLTTRNWSTIEKIIKKLD